MTFFAIAGSLWLMRNEVIFNEAIFYFEKIIICIKYRVTEWFKAKWPGAHVKNLNIAEFCVNGEVPLLKPKQNLVTPWTSPLPGQMKFNTDGSSFGNLGQSSIGGILKNAEGAVKLVFSKDIGSINSIEVELLAINKAFLFFAASLWAKTHELVIECDNSNVVKLISSPGFTPWKLRKHLSAIELAKSDVCGWQISHIPRAQNEMADKLDKSGLGRSNMLTVTFP
ncbi:hypothetical protein REPUB_Repub05bG0100500 [Reevesia pubescens]